MSGLLRTLALVSLSIHLSYGAILTNPAQLNNQTYDYIVVGGGTGGSVIAGRLAENTKARVLVIEAGISNQGVQNSIVPFFAFNASPNTYINWNFTTTPQSGLFNRVIDYPRGRLLGGSSSINIMIYTRGSSEEYDRIAQITGDQSWSYNNMLPYIRKHEKWMPPQDKHDTTGQYDPQYHSTTGKVLVSLPNYPTPIDERVMKTLGANGFNFVKDMNNGQTLGFGWTQATLGGGSRSSAATAYLTGQPNIDILVQTTVTRLIQQGKKNGRPYFNGVEFATSDSSPRYTVTASKEIVLSAGSIGTPQILMLSGIGPKNSLKNLGVTTIIDNKDVGQKLQDHAFMGHQFEVSGTETFETIAPNVPNLLPEWEASKTGPLSNGLANHIGWTRLSSLDPYLLLNKDPAAGRNSPHTEYIFSNGFGSFVGQTPSKPNYLSVFTSVASPSSRGSITLKSKNPFQSPDINPGFLTTALDLHVMVEAAKGVRKFLSAPAWKDYIIKPHETAANVNFNSDKEVEKYVKQYTGTQWHPTSTAAMSSSSSSDGVVDPKLCVKGAAGIRVVDASVFPVVPAAHLQAVLYAVSEKAADMIKAASC